MNDESLLTFPCEFAIKVMGLNTDSFEDEIFAIATLHVQGFEKESMSLTTSSAGKYVSVSVRVVAESKKALDDLYRVFHAHPDVKMVL